MSSRSAFIAGLLATGIAPTATWADLGAPKFVSAVRNADRRFALCGFGAGLEMAFQVPLPARGHAAVAHPFRPEVIAFARRPGTFAVAVDCMTGEIASTLTTPNDRHFYGHGVFSLDGSRLFTTENDFQNARGVIGIWDTKKGYTRVGEFYSGGIGPHDIKRLPGSETLVVANGGIETHPDAGRMKLNIPSMASNLSYIEGSDVAEVIELGAVHQRNSIRHLSVSDDGQVAFGMQWQGVGEVPEIVGIHTKGYAPVLYGSTDDMNGYIGSVAISSNGKTIAATSPRANKIQYFDVAKASHTVTDEVPDVGGIVSTEDGFLASNGGGDLIERQASQLIARRTFDLAFDNHLVAI